MAKRKTRGDAPTEDERIVQEAKRRFERANTWESVARKRFVDDVKFVNGDSDNLYQWPDTVRQSRGIGTRDERPCLTTNKTRQHCLQIINDARQNKTQCKVRPVGNEATYEAAQIYEGMVRRIEYISNADSAYLTATKFQVWGGIGYWRLVTDYIDDSTLDQDIFIRPIKDPMTVMMDPDAKEADGSDARFAFVFDDMERGEFEEAYPQFKDSVPLGPFGLSADDWLREDHVRVAEYFRRVEVEDKLIVFDDPERGRIQVRESEIGPALAKAVLDDPQTKHRALKSNRVEWFMIVGNEIVDRSIWVGETIPLYPVLGEITVIEGEFDRKGHVRALKDPQRMYNYNISAETEYGALQTKTPYTADVRAIENLTEYWETANVVNHSVLPYNGIDDDGNPIDRPERSPPPGVSQAYQFGMQQAATDMMLVSGQYEADFGAKSNERSGVAIQQRQRQGDNATYHYIDNLAMAIRRTCKDLIYIIPKVYDTKRALQIYAEDGTHSDVMIDPQQAQAYMKQQSQDRSAAEQIFINPNVGRYDVEADVGPSFATRRQEAFNAFVQILSQNESLTPIIGDLMFKNADFPGADELAERLKRMAPPQALGEGPPPAVLQMQQHIQGMQNLMMAMSQKLQEAESKSLHGDQEADTRMYEAITKRLDVLLKNAPDQSLAQGLEADLVRASHQTGLDMLKAEHASDLQAQQLEPAQ